MTLQRTLHNHQHFHTGTHYNVILPSHTEIVTRVLRGTATLSQCSLQCEVYDVSIVEPNVLVAHRADHVHIRYAICALFRNSDQKPFTDWIEKALSQKPKR
jgi:hypothetical protein